MSEAVRELIKAMRETNESLVTVSTRVVTAKDVDWEAKTMTAIGVSDELEYYDVILGIGSIHCKPKIGTLCLIGVIENKQAEAFLIEAQELDDVEVNTLNLVFNSGVNGGLVKVTVLQQELNKLMDFCNTLRIATQTMATALEALLPGTGSAFNTAMTGKTTGDFSGIENDKIKH